MSPRLSHGVARRGGHTLTIHGERVLGAIAGFGGHGGGDVAALIVRDLCRLDHIVDDGHEQRRRLHDAITRADVLVRELAKKDVAYRGLGATLTMATVGADALVIAHVGDARAYRIREDVVIPLTRDHRQQLYRDGIRSAVGALRELDVEVHPPLAWGELLVICHADVADRADWTSWLSLARTASSAEGASSEGAVSAAPSCDALASALLGLEGHPSETALVGRIDARP